MTVTFEFDLDSVKMNQHAKYLRHRSFSPHRNTHTRPTALPGPLKRSVERPELQLVVSGIFFSPKTGRRLVVSSIVDVTAGLFAG